MSSILQLFTEYDAARKAKQHEIATVIKKKIIYQFSTLQQFHRCFHDTPAGEVRLVEEHETMRERFLEADAFRDKLYDSPAR